MAQGVLELNSQSFQSEVMDSTTPVLVDFWATWCGPCLRLAPIVEELAKDNAGKVKIAKLDIDQASDLAAEWGVSSIPTLILFKGGQEQDRILGAVPKSQLQAMINKHANG
jgi:thioredoxin 1